MGKPTGFMEYTRQAIPERDPEVRTKDWEDYTLPLSDEEVQKQGARCHGLRRPYVSLRHGDQRHHNRMPCVPLNSRVE